MRSLRSERATSTSARSLARKAGRRLDVGLRVANGLVDGENETDGLSGGSQCVDLHDGGLPDACIVVVRDVLVEDVDTIPLTI